MADSSVVHIGENSPEHVALHLMEVISRLEKRPLYAGDPNPADRKWVLETYAQCISTVRNGFYNPD
ncbi:hypothetical protein EDC40_101349 [Aminobacter aminovorans]|uniref:Uncharacterized protein n=1 Tax=Aminobacter aminovorans TaxID=83263 RepID=A0A380WPV8_AMIAI|nr:hypothetical protein EDC40_101349 [Aminobacter aminovorans]SUU90881.1 Uncharacterised protein [Aminobacter aminovorans]